MNPAPPSTTTRIGAVCTCKASSGNCELRFIANDSLHGSWWIESIAGIIIFDFGDHIQISPASRLRYLPEHS
jgi:hypothetical protein